MTDNQIDKKNIYLYLLIQLPEIPSTEDAGGNQEVLDFINDLQNINHTKHIFAHNYRDFGVSNAIITISTCFSQCHHFKS